MAPIAASASGSVRSADVVGTARRTVTAARTAAASSVPAPAPAITEPTVAAVRKSVARTAAAPVPPSRPPRRPTAHRRRGGDRHAIVVRVAPATRRRSAPRLVADRTTAPAAPTGDRQLTPRHPDGPRTLAAAADDVPVAAAAAAGAGTAAAGLLALLTLVAFAAPRLGALIRLPAGRAPMPPLLALPERPG